LPWAVQLYSTDPSISLRSHTQNTSRIV
jgi:hypothetical protein